MIKKMICLVIIVILIGSLMADTLTLVNGETLNGKVTGYDKNNIYYETNGGDWAIIKKELITSNVRTFGIEIREGKSHYPGDFTRYRTYKMAKVQNDIGSGMPSFSGYPKLSQMNVGDSTDIKLAYLYEMQKFNSNMQLIYIPLWIGVGISVISIIVTASMIKKTKK